LKDQLVALRPVFRLVHLDEPPTTRIVGAAATEAILSVLQYGAAQYLVPGLPQLALGYHTVDQLQLVFSKGNSHRSRRSFLVGAPRTGVRGETAQFYQWTPAPSRRNWLGQVGAGAAGRADQPPGYWALGRAATVSASCPRRCSPGTPAPARSARRCSRPAPP